MQCIAQTVAHGTAQAQTGLQRDIGCAAFKYTSPCIHLLLAVLWPSQQLLELPSQGRLPVQASCPPEQYCNLHERYNKMSSDMHALSV